MATERTTIAYRPDDEERKLLTALKRRFGLSMSRVIGVAIRQMAEREGIRIKADDDSALSGESLL